MPDVPDVPGDAAGLRAANARLRELLAEWDEQVAGLQAQVAALAAALTQLQGRSRT